MPLEAMRGFVYFLTNASIPGLVKIGHTTQEVEARIKQFNSTGVPTPFVLAACFAVADSIRAERSLHEALASRRHSEDREFFVGSPAELLREVLPLLLEAMATTAPPTPKSKRRRAYDLEPESVELLLFLSGYQRRYGYSEDDVLRSTKEPELKTEARLASLKELKLVSEKRSRREWEPSTWRITSEGKKYLFDYGHVTDDMLQE